MASLVLWIEHGHDYSIMQEIVGDFALYLGLYEIVADNELLFWRTRRMDG